MTGKKDSKVLDIIVNSFIILTSFGYVIRNENKWIRALYKLILIASLILVPSSISGFLAMIIVNADGRYVFAIVSAILIFIIGIIELLNFRKSIIEDCVRDFFILVSVGKENSIRIKRFFIRAVALVVSIIVVTVMLYIGFSILLKTLGIAGELVDIIDIVISGSLAYILLVYGKRGISTDLQEYRKALIDFVFGVILVGFSIIQIWEYGGNLPIKEYVGVILLYLWAFSLVPSIAGAVSRMYQRLRQELSQDIAKRRTLEILKCYYWKYKCLIFKRKCRDFWMNISAAKYVKKDKNRLFKTIFFMIVSVVLAFVLQICMTYVSNVWITPMISKMERWVELWIAGMDSKRKGILSNGCMIIFLMFLIIMCFVSMIKKIKANSNKNWKEIIKDFLYLVTIVLLLCMCLLKFF